jgi:hypothetical protein
VLCLKLSSSSLVEARPLSPGLRGPSEPPTHLGLAAALRREFTGSPGKNLSNGTYKTPHTTFFHQFWKVARIHFFSFAHHKLLIFTEAAMSTPPPGARFQQLYQLAAIRAQKMQGVFSALEADARLAASPTLSPRSVAIAMGMDERTLARIYGSSGWGGGSHGEQALGREPVQPSAGGGVRRASIAGGALLQQPAPKPTPQRRHSLPEALVSPLHPAAAGAEAASAAFLERMRRGREQAQERAAAALHGKGPPPPRLHARSPPAAAAWLHPHRAPPGHSPAAAAAAWLPPHTHEEERLALQAAVAAAVAAAAPHGGQRALAEAREADARVAAAAAAVRAAAVAARRQAGEAAENARVLAAAAEAEAARRMAAEARERAAAAAARRHAAAAAEAERKLAAAEDTEAARRQAAAAAARRQAAAVEAAHRLAAAGEAEAARRHAAAAAEAAARQRAAKFRAAQEAAAAAAAAEREGRGRHAREAAAATEAALRQQRVHAAAGGRAAELRAAQEAAAASAAAASAAEREARDRQAWEAAAARQRAHAAAELRAAELRAAQEAAAAAAGQRAHAAAEGRAAQLRAAEEAAAAAAATAAEREARDRHAREAAGAAAEAAARQRAHAASEVRAAELRAAQEAAAVSEKDARDRHAREAAAAAAEAAARQRAHAAAEARAAELRAAQEAAAAAAAAAERESRDRHAREAAAAAAAAAERESRERHAREAEAAARQRAHAAAEQRAAEQRAAQEAAAAAAAAAAEKEARDRRVREAAAAAALQGGGASAAAQPARDARTGTYPFALSGTWTRAECTGYREVDEAPQWRIVPAASGSLTLTVEGGYNSPSSSVTLVPAHPRGAKFSGEPHEFGVFSNRKSSFTTQVSAGTAYTLILATFSPGIEAGKTELGWKITGSLPLLEPPTPLTQALRAILDADAQAAKAAEKARRAAALALMQSAPPGTTAKESYEDFLTASARVEALRAECRAKGRPFEDGWSGSSKALGAWTGEKAEWARFAQLAPNPVVFENGYRLQDVEQGALGDCYFLAAVADLAGGLGAHLEGVLDTLFVTGEPNPEGVYCVRLWVAGRWQHFFMDDRLPCRPDSYVSIGQPDALFKRTATSGPDPSHGRFIPLRSVSSHSRNAMWPCLLEKAWAMLHGSYADIEGHARSDALSPLNYFLPHSLEYTCQPVPLPSGGYSSSSGGNRDTVLSEDELWDKLMLWQAKGWPMTTGSRTTAASGAGGDHGIVRKHAFSLMRVFTTPTNLGGEHLLQLRNPHGEGEWDGRYSDKDTASWTPALRAVTGYNPEASGNDGIFFMCLQDFQFQFGSVNVTPNVCLAKDGGGWHKAEVRGTFTSAQLRASAAQGDWLDKALQFPQLLIHSGGASGEVTVMLELDQRSRKEGARHPEIVLHCYSYRNGTGVTPAKSRDHYYSSDKPSTIQSLKGLSFSNGCSAITRQYLPGSSLVFIPEAEGLEGRDSASYTLSVLSETAFTCRVAQPGAGSSTEEGVAWLSK